MSYSFKGDIGNSKYQTSLLNGDKHSVIDILVLEIRPFCLNTLKMFLTRRDKKLSFL